MRSRVHSFDLSQLLSKPALLSVASLYLSSLLIDVQQQHSYLHKYFLFHCDSNKQNISKGPQCSQEVGMHTNTGRVQTVGRLSFWQAKNFSSHLTLLALASLGSDCALLS